MHDGILAIYWRAARPPRCRQGEAARGASGHRRREPRYGRGRSVGRAKEVSQSRGVRRGVRGCFAFLPFFNTKITMEIPDVFYIAIP